MTRYFMSLYHTKKTMQIVFHLNIVSGARLGNVKYILDGQLLPVIVF